MIVLIAKLLEFIDVQRNIDHSYATMFSFFDVDISMHLLMFMNFCDSISISSVGTNRAYTFID